MSASILITNASVMGGAVENILIKDGVIAGRGVAADTAADMVIDAAGAINTLVRFDKIAGRLDVQAFLSNDVRRKLFKMVQP